MLEDAEEQALLDEVEALAEAKSASLRAIGRMLGERGALNRSGKPFSASSVARLVEAVGRRREGAAA
jgi:hypothetical protein